MVGVYHVAQPKFVNLTAPLWLLRTLKPDFKTIADFRRDNRAAFRAVFRQFVLLCRRLDLYGRELLAVDGTRIKAVNNKDRNFTRSSLREFIRRADEWLEDYLKRLDEGDVEDGATGGGARTKNLAEKIAALSEKRGRYQAMLAQLDRTGEDQISLTDPDSRAMAAHTKVGVGYNVQSGGRREEQADRRAGCDQPGRGHGPADADRRAGPRSPGRQDDRRRRRSRLLQNRGYRGLREDRLRSPRCQAAAWLVGARGPVSQGRVPIRRRARRLRLPGREVADADPPGPDARSRKDRLRNPKACRACPLRARCTTDARSVFRLENEAVLDRMAERLKARPAISTAAARSSNTHAAALSSGCIRAPS